jgi:AdoMet-dependent heme synthase
VAKEWLTHFHHQVTKAPRDKKKFMNEKKPYRSTPDFRPSLVSWNITRQCNLNCLHCYREAAAACDPRELSTQEGLDLISEIAKAGFRILVLSGGEPLLRQDIYELAQHAHMLGLRVVVGSNGTLIDEQVARRLKEAGVVRVGISLDSRDPDFHNHLRASPDAWQRAIAGMEACKKAGLAFQIHTTVTEHNRAQVLGVIDLAVELGAAAHHVFFLVPAGRGADLEADSLNAQEYEQLLRALMRKQQEVNIELKPTCAPQFMRIAAQMKIPLRFERGCLAGNAYCVINHIGEVNPCPYLPLKVGDVRERPFSEIWADTEVFNTLRSEELHGKCNGCRYKTICMGCRARAYFYNDGDYMASEPWCAYPG